MLPSHLASIYHLLAVVSHHQSLSKLSKHWPYYCDSCFLVIETKSSDQKKARILSNLEVNYPVIRPRIGLQTKPNKGSIYPLTGCFSESIRHLPLQLSSPIPGLLGAPRCPVRSNSLCGESPPNSFQFYEVLL